MPSPQCRQRTIVKAAALASVLAERRSSHDGRPSSWSSFRKIKCEPVPQQQQQQQQQPPLEPLARPPTITWWNKTLATLHLSSLPLPRTLLPNDPEFSNSTLRRGIRQRELGEAKLQQLQHKIQQVQGTPKAHEETQKILAEVTEIAFGKGVTPQEREDFLARYGCTGWTPEVIKKLLELGKERGFVEIGAGHGQWARALVDAAQTHENSNVHKDKYFEFVLAYDTMQELPLNTNIYHPHTKPAHDFFYDKVRKMETAEATLRQWSCRGRILLIVYPSPGNMALETVKAYVAMGEENDTVVYVGEGRGGCNANDALFDYFEANQDWILKDVVPVVAQPGGSGFEKMYILQKRSPR